MRIQHNIMAMNAYRNYNNNNKALSGNLEKLSSGYKINRAGDDAAGLAISEKMRAQITGLNAAQKNVKDGISLVKTAEGAMQEIQDMLNRMDYLATQSANGTYDNEVDRANLQKEVEALKTEINRIADSANFNGIKLLDGSKDSDGSAAAAESAKVAAEAAKAVVNSLTEKLQAAKDAAPSLDAETLKANYSKDMTKDEVEDLLLDAPPAGTSGSAASVGQVTIFETDTVNTTTPSFKVSFDGVSHTMAGTGVNTNAAVTLVISGKDGDSSAATIALNEADIKDYLEAIGEDVTDLKGTKVTGAQLAGALVYKIQGTTGGIGNSAAASVSATGGKDGRVLDGTNAWDVKVTGDNNDTIEFGFADTNDALTAAMNKHFDIKLQGAALNPVAATKNTYATGTMTITAGTNTQAVGTVTVNYKKADGTTASAAVTFEYNATNATSTTFATAAAAALNKNADLRGLFSASAANGVLTVETRQAGENNIKVDGITYAGGTGGATIAGGAKDADASFDGENAYKSGTDGYVNAGTEVVLMGAPTPSDQLASTTIKLDATDITDGMQITLGKGDDAVTYTFAVGKDSIVETKNDDGTTKANVIDLTKFKAEELTADAANKANRAEAFTKFSEVAKNNETFTVSHAGTVGYIGLKQLQSAKADTDMTDMDHLLDYIGITTVDKDAAMNEAETAKANKVAKLEKDLADAQKAADEAQKAADKAAAKAEIGKPLTLQIGDTSDKFNQMEVKIGDMHTAAMGTGKATLDGEEIEVTKTIADISVGKQEDAAEAVQVIKNAINYVSGIRGDLGAIQNRLDHTANNLSVMAENIQDAESTIRDTDVAEEMMSYVKNNILVQSAQAMLAQANQVPQGVLQLLG